MDLDRPIDRRSFFARSGAGLVGSILGAGLSGVAGPGRSAAAPLRTSPELPAVRTVTGPIDSGDMGLTLPHEHVMSQFGGPAVPDPSYDRDRFYRVVVPYLRVLGELGVDTICECTAAYFGRHPELLRELSERSGVQILTNTGYYGAAGDTYVPEHAFSDSVERLADRWIGEARDGIDGTGIRPGFIKTGIDSAPLSAVDRKLVEAAARTHAETGLTIAVHTSGRPRAVTDQLAILEKAGVDPSAWIWVHAQNVEATQDLAEAAEEGAWIEFDGLQADSLDRHLELVDHMRDRGRLDQVLLSHDGNAHPGEHRPIRHFDVLSSTFLGLLRSEGYSDREIRLLTVENPQRAFSPRVRTG